MCLLNAEQPWHRLTLCGLAFSGAPGGALVWEAQAGGDAFWSLPGGTGSETPGPQAQPGETSSRRQAVLGKPSAGHLTGGLRRTLRENKENLLAVYNSKRQINLELKKKITN